MSGHKSHLIQRARPRWISFSQLKWLSSLPFQMTKPVDNGQNPDGSVSCRPLVLHIFLHIINWVNPYLKFAAESNWWCVVFRSKRSWICCIPFIQTTCWKSGSKTKTSLLFTRTERWIAATVRLYVTSLTTAFLNIEFYTHLWAFATLHATVALWGSLQLLEVLEILEIYWNFVSLLEILEISWNLIGPPGRLQNIGSRAGIHAVLVSWLDGTVMSFGRSSSSHAHLEIVHTLLVVVISLIKL